MDTAESQKDSFIRRLQEWDAQAVAEVIEFRGETTVVVPREHLRRAAEFLLSDPKLQFTFLSDITAVDKFPLEPRFELNYHLLSLEHRERIRLKVRLPGNDPVVHSVTSIWPAANWHERENFDLMGIRFEGHPELLRILMPDDWEGYPLRKDYPVEGYR
ncbi:MAG TPA: NADH-quinone oxidoreductase subunit C [Candidatus Acidoferrales bacterium]